MDNNYSGKRMREFLAKTEKGEDVSNFQFTHPKTKDEAKLWNYNFWNTQPVTQLDTIATLPKIIDKEFGYDKMNKMYYPYEWKDFDLNNDIELDSIVKFLNKNYYDQDQDNKNKKIKFVPVFTKEYIKLILGNKGQILGITTNKNNKIIIGGLVCLSVRNMQLFDLTTEVCNVMYMLIHKSLREKQIAELMIKEITRKLTLKGIKVGMFSTYEYIPTPICEISEYQRPINYQKLYDLGFATLENKNELNIAIREYKITATSKGTKLTVNNVEDAYKKLCEYQDRYNIYELYTLEQFIETFLDNECVSSFVIIENDEVKDFYSYYKYSLTNPKNDKLINVAKMFIYSSNEITPLSLFKNAIIDASTENIDVFMCSDIMENNEICYDNVNKFTQTSSVAYLNTFNWECPEISPEQVSCSVWY